LDELDLFLAHPAEAGQELGANLATARGIDDRRGRCDAHDLVCRLAGERSQTSDQARDLGAGRTRIRVRLVKDDKAEGRSSEELETEAVVASS